MLGGLDRLGGVGIGLATRVLELAVVIGLLTPVVLGLSMGIPEQGGLLQSFSQAWHQSAADPVLQQHLEYDGGAGPERASFQMI